MKNSYQIFPDKSLVLMNISDKFDFRSFQQFFSEFLDDPTLKPKFDIFCNATQLNFRSMTMDDIQKLLRLSEYIEKRKKDGRTAFLVSSQLGFGLARMLEIMMGQTTQLNIRVFKEIEKAEYWLGKKASWFYQNQTI